MPPKSKKRKATPAEPADYLGDFLKQNEKKCVQAFTQLCKRMRAAGVTQVMYTDHPSYYFQHGLVKAHPIPHGTLRNRKKWAALATKITGSTKSESPGEWQPTTDFLAYVNGLGLAEESEEYDDLMFVNMSRTWAWYVECFRKVPKKVSEGMHVCFFSNGMGDTIDVATGIEIDPYVYEQSGEDPPYIEVQIEDGSDSEDEPQPRKKSTAKKSPPAKSPSSGKKAASEKSAGGVKTKRRKTK